MTDDDFRALERERTQALVRRDMPAIEQLHAPDYELITPAGKVFTRALYLAAIAEQPFYSAWDLGAVRVRRCPAMAVLRYPARIGFPSGGVVDCWHTDVYELRAGAWQAVWSQATRRPGPPTGNSA
jgi:hypothetical protein